MRVCRPAAKAPARSSQQSYTEDNDDDDDDTYNSLVADDVIEIDPTDKATGRNDENPFRSTVNARSFMSVFDHRDQDTCAVER